MRFRRPPAFALDDRKAGERMDARVAESALQENFGLNRIVYRNCVCGWPTEIVPLKYVPFTELVALVVSI